MAEKKERNMPTTAHSASSQSLIDDMNDSSGTSAVKATGQELELLSQENKQLKKRIEKLLNENIELKRSLFQLNVHYNALNARQLVETSTAGTHSGSSSPSTQSVIVGNPYVPKGSFFDLDKYDSEIEELLSDNEHLRALSHHHHHTQQEHAPISTSGNGSQSAGAAIVHHGQSVSMAQGSAGRRTLPSEFSVAAAVVGGSPLSAAPLASFGNAQQTSGEAITSNAAVEDGTTSPRSTSTVLTFDSEGVVASQEQPEGQEGKPKGSIRRSLQPKSSRQCLDDSRKFHFKFELSGTRDSHEGHTGAIYNARFSIDGQVLATCSFDRSVIIWNIGVQEQICKLQGHDASVLDVCFDDDGNSSFLASAGVDRAVKLWDLTSGRVIRSYETEGFAQAVQLSSSVLFAADTRKNLFVFDARTPQPKVAAIRMVNDAVVNSVRVLQNTSSILTGDHKGWIKAWDSRRPQTCVESFQNDVLGSSISSICLSMLQSATAGTLLDRYLAVNSYDSVLRVYDRGSGTGFAGTLASQKPARYKLIHNLLGHKNQNWPIKSSMFCGQGYDPRLAKKNYDGSLMHGKFPPLQQSLLLATGSADGKVYLYDISTAQSQSTPIQVLDNSNISSPSQPTDAILEHGGAICYGAQFHPSEPLLVSYSSDMKIRVYGT